MTFLFVLIGWVFSLTLHEFSHALIAFWGGDTSVREKGYLTFNPLKYTHPLYSLLLPLLFLVAGGIGLPGGAVYIETWRLRSPRWESAVSLAGPFSNLLLAALLSRALRFAPFPAEGLWPGLAFLAWLQVMAAVLNLLPIPPLDGYGVIAPWLRPEWRARIGQWGHYSIWILFLLLWYVPWAGDIFWMTVSWLAGSMGIPLSLAAQGWAAFQIFHF